MCSSDLQQVQGYMHAMKLSGGDASCRIVAGAHHSFDRDTAVELIEDASVSPSAPTTFLTDAGEYIHPVDGVCPGDTSDRDLMIYGVKIAVDKSLTSEQKSDAWNLIATYDMLMRKCGVGLINWTIVDVGHIFVIVALIPGDYEPELSYAKDIIHSEIDAMTMGDIMIQPADPEDFF